MNLLLLPSLRDRHWWSNEGGGSRTGRAGAGVITVLSSHNRMEGKYDSKGNGSSHSFPSLIKGVGTNDYDSIMVMANDRELKGGMRAGRKPFPAR